MPELLELRTALPVGGTCVNVIVNIINIGTIHPPVVQLPEATPLVLGSLEERQRWRASEAELGAVLKVVIAAVSAY